MEKSKADATTAFITGAYANVHVNQRLRKSRSNVLVFIVIALEGWARSRRNDRGKARLKRDLEKSL